jgi:hypothetical protein
MNGLKTLKYFDFWGYNYLDFNTISDLVMNGVYFYAEDGDWRFAKPQINMSEAYISVFADNDKQFVDFLDSKKASAIVRAYFMGKIR